MTRHLLLTISSLALGTALFSQCPASFTWSQSQPNVIAFTNTSSPQNPNFTNYWWDFGDAQATPGFNVTHTYSAPGTYTVCLTLYDSLSMLQCQYCDTVVVTGSVLCNMWCNVQQTAQASCANCFDGSIVAGVVNGTPPFSFQWNTGATTQVLTNVAPGYYSVCVTDANGCTSCDSGYVTTPVTTCSITFNPTVQSNGWVDFNDYATWSNNMYPIVTWNFGDATTGTGLNMWHQYAASGTYYVCVTLLDTVINCTASFCDTVVVNLGPPAPSCDANFVVMMDSVNTNQAWIYNWSTGGPGMTYQWWWGDNTPADTGAYPQHVYQNTGSYNVCLIVVDQANQCTDTMCQLLWVPRLSYEASLAPFYVNVVPPLSMNVTDPSVNNDWTLYPNPAKSLITIGGAFTANDHYIITDLTGRVIANGSLGYTTLDISNFASGTFVFTVVKESGQTESKRFVRE